MTKFTFILVAMMTLFCSCSSDDDTNSLDGTTWVSEKVEQRFTLKFGKSTATFIYEYDDDGDGQIESSETKEESVATYTLDGNNVVLKVGKSTATGTVSGNKLVLSADGDSVTYYKK